MNFCFTRKKKLFIAFIDFSKAYDRVPRDILMKILKKLGCGLAMLFAILTMYKITHSILGIAVISAVVGVRQGSPTSCFLFIVYVNVLIRNIKTNSLPDSFLQWLHVLMLMDDTVIFASSRERLLDKLSILDEYCDTHGMAMNQKKTEFMVIHGDSSDMLPIKLREILMKPCKSYIYLGSIFCSDGSTVTSLKAHVDAKKKQLNKLFIFLRVNKDMPFAVKRKVVEAAYSASILYGSEAWLNVGLRILEPLYMSSIRALLGVRHSIPGEICLLECNMPPLRTLIRQKQSNFFNKMLNERSDMEDDPLMFALNLTQTDNRNMYKYVESIVTQDPLASEADMNKMRAKISESEATRFKTYYEINESLDMHSVYSRRLNKDFIPEHYRTAFTRMRTSSHRLRVETGRWINMNRNLRLCKCKLEVQDERHVLTKCPMTKHLRDSFGRTIQYPEILFNPQSIEEFKFIYDVLKVSE